MQGDMPRWGASNEYPQHMPADVPRKCASNEYLQQMPEISTHNICRRGLSYAYPRHMPEEMPSKALSLRKHAYSNILEILPPKTVSFLDKNSDIFYITALKQR